MSENRDSTTRRHTPPLGFNALTPLYDLVIATLTRESAWRSALIREIAPQAGDRIVDIGSGTGSLAVALHKASAGVRYVGVEPDAEAIRRAKMKTAGLDRIEFALGYFSGERAYFEARPNKVVSSLVLHQTPLTEKRRILSEMRKCLAPGGSAVIADYGWQGPLMRLLFRMTVQTLDGAMDTQPNADGAIPVLMKDAGFSDVQERFRINTATGTISIYRAGK